MDKDALNEILGGLYDNGIKPDALLAKAVELGASEEYLTGLLENEMMGAEFQKAFLANTLAWEVFTKDGLVGIMKRIAAECSEQVIGQSKAIEARVGHSVVYEILTIAVTELYFIYEDSTLKQLEGLPSKFQEKAALQLKPDWRTIPFIVRALKSHANNWSAHDQYRYMRTLFNKEWVLTVPTALRWAMLGGGQWFFPDGKLGMEDDFVGHPTWPNCVTWWQNLRKQAEEAGWQFVKLVRRTVNGKSELVAEVTNTGLKGVTKVVYVHNNNGARGDRLEEGDEAMVIQKPTETEIPVRHVHDRRKLLLQRIGNEVWVKPYELHPVAKPTVEMLRNPEKYFGGADIPLTPKAEEPLARPRR